MNLTNNRCISMHLYIKAFLFYLYIIYCHFSNAGDKPISQQLYEEINKTYCRESSFAEVTQLIGILKCSNVSPQYRVGLNSTVNNLEQISEAIMFDTLAQNQTASLQCANSNIDDYLNYDQFRMQLSDVACEKFGLMREFLKEQESIKDSIKSYQSINNPLLRVVPKEERIKYKKVLSELGKRQQILASMISNIRQSTLLFESQEAFDFAIKKLKSNEEEKKVCSLFKEKLPSLLKETNSKIQETLNELKNKKLTSNQKEQLWQFSRSDDLINKLAQNEVTQKGVVCRLEGRYGKGAKIRDGLVQIGLFALPSFLKLTESIAVASFAARSRIPFNVSRVVMTAEVALGTTLSVDAIKKDCIDKNLSVLVEKNDTCVSSSAEERKNALLAVQNQNSCILSATLGMANAYFSVGAIDKTLKGLIPDSLMIKIGQSNSRISSFLSQRGFYDAVEVISVKNEGVGKIVTIARKAGEAGLVRRGLDGLSIPDPVFSSQKLIDNLGSASKNLRLSTTNGTYQLPDVTLYSDRIAKYNALAAPNQKIAVMFYKTKDKIQGARSYNSRFIEEGGLPMAPSGTPSSTFTKTGHLHLHDITAHGASVTIPQEIIANARASYRIVNEFEDYLKIKSPSLYSLAKKKTTYTDSIFDSTQSEMARITDLSTGNWTHFITNMKKGDMKNASYSLSAQSKYFTNARNMNDAIKEVTYAFKYEKKIDDAFNEFIKSKKDDLNKPIFPGTENMNRVEYLQFLFRKQQDLTNAIGNKSF